MKLNLSAKLRLVTIFLMLFLTISSGATLMTGCGSADAEKDAKAKKKKKKVTLEEEEVEKKDSKEENLESNNSKSGEQDSSKSVDGNENTRNSPPKNAKNEEAEKIWKDLISGNQRFAAGKPATVNFASARKSLTGGQKPEVIVLGCADSRVPPEFVFDKNLGELFVVRAAGNITDRVSLGSIEYAVEHLHSKVLVILGHESCGAVAAAVSNEEMPTKNLEAIVNRIMPALEGTESCPPGGKMKNACVEQNVVQSSKDVVKNSPIIKKAVDEGKLTIIRAVYQLESGKVVRQD